MKRDWPPVGPRIVNSNAQLPDARLWGFKVERDMKAGGDQKKRTKQYKREREDERNGGGCRPG